MDKIVEFLRNRRQRIIDGKINCIPLPYPRLSSWFPGLEKRRYIVWTANQKVKDNLL